MRFELYESFVGISEKKRSISTQILAKYHCKIIFPAGGSPLPHYPFNDQRNYALFSFFIFSSTCSPGSHQVNGIFVRIDKK
jgi:hypothetical protein